jgi:hypothetical protein
MPEWPKSDALSALVRHAAVAFSAAVTLEELGIARTRELTLKETRNIWLKRRCI